MKDMMNSFYKKINGLVICALLISAFPVYSMQNEKSSDSVESKNNSEWNKQNLIVLSLLMAGVYICAVYQDKIASPLALWKRMFYQSVPEPIINQPTIIESKQESMQPKENDQDEEYFKDGFDDDNAEKDIQNNDDNYQIDCDNLEIPAQNDNQENLLSELNDQVSIDEGEKKSILDKVRKDLRAWLQEEMLTE